MTPIVIIGAHLIAGTGYRVSLEQPPFLEAQLLEHLRHIEGSPVVERHSIDTEAGKLAELFRLAYAGS